ncbi:hypothetical protein [Arthrobacter sp. 8AJ]|uniref:hypothetical protein n=1 Tax=Arthrobacter sp. 8AJ TaxID=2653130 RepID=UPI0012F0A618|nr:hypothetical protein [Arthrobacter sp. 8AJ]VXC35816.1 hypothetical protein ARTHRO8AJ_460070 [Arthrobacter sp. 8AJ]
MERLPDALITTAMLLAAVFVAFLVLALLFRWVGFARARRRFSDLDMDRLREELVEHVSSKSKNRRQPVPLKIFWKGRRIPRTARYEVVKPLLEEGILHTVEKDKPASEGQDLADDFKRWLNGQGDRFFAWLTPMAPEIVFLSDMDWEVLKRQHYSARQLLEMRNVINVFGDGNTFGNGNQVDHSRHVDKSRHKTRAGRDNIGSGISGGSTVSVRWLNGSNETENLAALAAALRKDAAALESDDDRAFARSLATRVDEKAAAAEPDKEEVAHVLQRVASFVTPLATAMTETHKILGIFWPSETG